MTNRVCEILAFFFFRIYKVLKLKTDYTCCQAKYKVVRALTLRKYIEFLI